MAYIRVSTVTWKIDMGSEAGQAITRKVREEAVPYLRTLPGFVSFLGARADSRTTINVYTWDTADHLKSGTEKFRDWVYQVGIGEQIASVDGAEGERSSPLPSRL